MKIFAECGNANLSILDKNTLMMKIQSAVQDATHIVEREAKENCPVGDTGILRASITSEFKKDDKSVTGIVGSNVSYSAFVEFGTGLYSSKGDGRQDVPWRYQDANGEWHTTSGMKPQPYLIPALDNNIQTVSDIIMEAFK